MLRLQTQLLTVSICLIALPLVHAIPTTVNQVVNVQLIKYGTYLPIPGVINLSYSCMNYDGSWYPYSAEYTVNATGAGTIMIGCNSPSVFNPWLHVYGQSGAWYGTATLNGIPPQGGPPAFIIVILNLNSNYRHS